MTSKLILPALALAALGAWALSSQASCAQQQGFETTDSDPAADTLTASSTATPSTPHRARVATPSRLRLQVLDRVSGRPLAGVEISLTDSAGGEGWTTDAEGWATILRASGLQTKDLTLTVGGTKPRRFQRQAAWREDRTATVTLPLLAKVVVHLQPGALASAQGRVVLRPRISSDLNSLDSATRRRLALAAFHPETLRQRQATYRVAKPAPTQRQDFQLKRDGTAPPTLEFFCGHFGRVDLAAHGAARGPRGLPAQLRNSFVWCETRPGSIATVSIPLQPKPWVRGRLRDHNGKPLAGVAVTAAARASFDAGETVPHETDEPLSASMCVSRRAGASGVTGLLRQTGRTDAQGRFAIPLSFTGEVAVWAYPEGREPAYLEAQAKARFANVSDLELESWPLERRRIVSLMAPSGEPIADRRVRLVRTAADNRFQHHPPELKTDANGKLDVSFAAPKTEFLLCFLDAAFASTCFRIGARPTIQVQARPIKAE